MGKNLDCWNHPQMLSLKNDCWNQPQILSLKNDCWNHPQILSLKNSRGGGELPKLFFFCAKSIQNQKQWDNFYSQNIQKLKYKFFFYWENFFFDSAYFFFRFSSNDTWLIIEKLCGSKKRAKIFFFPTMIHIIWTITPSLYALI